MKELRSLQELADCKPGEQVSFFAVLVDIKQQTTNAGKEYARLYLRDDRGAVTVPLWNDTLDSAQKAYTVDEVYSFVAVTDEYQGKINIKRILSLSVITEENIIKRLKQHMYKEATEKNIQIVLATVKSLLSSIYGPYISAVYGIGSRDDEKFIALCKAYASINHHDNYPGGFINHVGGMLAIVAFLKSQYLSGRCEDTWHIDWQYIIAAILLHDIGKLETYSPVTDFTIRFKDDCLLDHNSLGVAMLYAIDAMITEDKRISYELLQRLMYTILYHDNIDKLYTHKFLEDKIISYVDGLDATLAVACEINVV